MAYTTIDDPSAYFQATTYTGNSGNGHVITHTGNSDLQADFIWIKMRSAGYFHVLYDTNRRPSGTPFSGSLYVLTGGDGYGTGAENTGAYGPTAIGSNSVSMNSYDTINLNNETLVSWNWKANGGTTTAFSESGSNPGGTYQKNETAGFSVVTYTGTGTAGEVTHGLTTQPQVVIVKRRDASGAWATYHESAGITGTLFLNESTAKGDTTAYFHTGWGAATKFPIGTNAITNADDGTYVAYAFAEVQGYSKFGSYVGNGSANGPFVYLGFKPAFIMTKRTDSAGGWVISDLKRSGYNGGNKELFANLDQAEDSDSRYDLLSNGFKIRVNYASSNASGGTFIYMAFAENPFTTSTGVPTTAR